MWLIDVRLYSTILRSLEQTHCARMLFYMSDWLSIARFLNIHWSGVLTALAWLVPHETAAVSAQVLCTPYNHAPCHFMQSHIRKVYVCLAVTCHLHFWQNDRGLLRATAWLCVCVCVCACVCVRVCVGGNLRVHMSTRMCAHARGLTIHQMGTADVEILSTQCFQTLPLLRNDVHLEDFMHLIILVAVEAPFFFSGVSLSVEGSKVVRKENLQKKFDHLGLGSLRVAGKIIINSNENMSGIYYATKLQDAAWNETSHPKSVHIYLLSHQTIPAIQSNIHNTQSNHIFTQSLYLVIFHTAHRATSSSNLVVY